jgi:hypothetical protein
VNEAKVRWTLSKDSKDIGQTGEAKLANGRALVRSQLDGPGFLQCRADITPPGEIPAFCDHTCIVAGRINGWPRLIPNETEKPSETAVNAVRYYDAVNIATRTKAQAFVTVGFIDIVCPPTGMYTAYSQLAGGKRIWNHLDTGHISKPEDEARVRQEVLGYIRQNLRRSQRDTNSRLALRRCRGSPFRSWGRQGSPATLEERTADAI